MSFSEEEILKMLKKFNTEYTCIKTGLTRDELKMIKIRWGLIRSMRPPGLTAEQAERAAAKRKNKDMVRLVAQINKVNKMNLVFRE